MAERRAYAGRAIRQVSLSGGDVEACAGGHATQSGRNSCATGRLREARARGAECGGGRADVDTCQPWQEGLPGHSGNPLTNSATL